MNVQHFTYRDPEGVELFVYGWFPAGGAPVRAIVQILHGMAETAARYERFAERLTATGYIVYAHDHRGHGRTAGSVERLGILGKDGFTRMVDNAAQLSEWIKERHGELPLYLFGHSMGSFVAQQYMYRYPDKVNGVILSGTNGKQGALLNLGIMLARREATRKGEEHRSELLNRMVFGGYNKAFKPSRTDFDWLSRDREEVDKYIRDPYCGGVFPASFFRDFFLGLKEIHRRENIERIPKSLPVYLFAGDRDPVGRMGGGVRQLHRMYLKLGLTNVSLKLYPGGRHEMLNETNREEVMQDVLAWLEAQIGRVK